MRTRLQQLSAHLTLSCQKLPPLVQDSITHEFERLAMVDVAIEIEMVME